MLCKLLSAQLIYKPFKQVLTRALTWTPFDHRVYDSWFSCSARDSALIRNRMLCLRLLSSAYSVPDEHCTQAALSRTNRFRRSQESRSRAQHAVSEPHLRRYRAGRAMRSTLAESRWVCTPFQPRILCSWILAVQHIHSLCACACAYVCQTLFCILHCGGNSAAANITDSVTCTSERYIYYLSF